MSHVLVAAAAAGLGTFFASSADWAVDGRAWLRRQTLGRLGR